MKSLLEIQRLADTNRPQLTRHVPKLKRREQRQQQWEARQKAAKKHTKEKGEVSA